MGTIALLVVLVLTLTGRARAGEGTPQPIRDLDQPGRLRFLVGLAAFEREETASSGLGPVFNATSCVACHGHPATGGSSEVLVERFGRRGPSGFDPMEEAGGPVIQKEGLVLGSCAVPGERVPADATVVTRRSTPGLFGLGYVDAIPDGRILRHADPDDRNHDGVSGRPNLIAGRVARFGWKAQITTVRDFVAAALLNELGITTRSFPDDLLPQGRPTQCDPMADPEDGGARVEALTDFIGLLAPPPRDRPTGAARLGRRVFERVGCGRCHLTTLRSAFPMPRRQVPLFSDLLLHDMGAELADGIEQGTATGAEFRTAPLWGVRQSAPYLHDGRAGTLADAIAAHGGEGETARRAFLALPERSRSALLAYLESL